MTTAPLPRRGRGKSQKSLDLIRATRAILAEIQPASVRAVAYQLFDRRLIPDMSRKSVAKVSTLLTWAREQGVIPWAWIVDEARSVEGVSTWEDPEAYQAAVISSYRRDAWAQQRYCVEVWSEKGTIRGALAPVLTRYAVPFRVMHGFVSATVVHDVAEQTQADDRTLVVLYVGDWDPSGLYMSEVDIPKRMREYGAVRFVIVRIALGAKDVYQGTLPQHPVEEKEKDPRHAWFLAKYGAQFWEVDALSPVILRERVEAEILSLIDRDLWERSSRVEAAELDTLKTVISAWKGVA